MKYIFTLFFMFFLIYGLAQESVFVEEPVSMTLPADVKINKVLKSSSGEHVRMNGRSWQVIYSDDFEGIFPGEWSVSTFPVAYWNKWDCWSVSGDYSAGCAAGGSGAISCGDDYLSDMNTWMVYGPFDLSDANITDAEMIYELNLNSLSFDFLKALASINGTNFYGGGIAGTGISTMTLDLTNVPGLGNVLGEDEVWIAFVFQSTSSDETSNGAQVDDVWILKDHSDPSAQDIDAYPSKIVFDEILQPGNYPETNRSPVREFNGNRAVANLFPGYYDVSQLNTRQLHFYNKYLDQATTSEIFIVDINFDLFNIDDVININLPRQTENLIYRTQKNIRSKSDFSWFGKFLLESNSHAVFVRNFQDLSGSVRLGNELYSVKPLGGGLQALIRIDQSNYPEDHPPEYHEIEKNPGTLENLREQKGSRADDGSVISVLVAYTPAAEAAVANINSLIQLAVDESNQSYTNSDIDPDIYLVHKYETSYTESGSFSTDLQRFREKDDGYMDEVHDYRDAYGADVCVLIIDNTSYCGLASGILVNESNSFCAVHHGCATGYYSFAHEIGHLQGSRHNPEEDPSTTPFPYGHGYLYYTGGWRTIMAYNDEILCDAWPSDYCIRLQYWSNPDVNYGAYRVPMGTTGTHDNARVLDETASYIAGFRPSDTTYFKIINEGGDTLRVDSLKVNRDWLSLFQYPATPFNILGYGSQKIWATVDWTEVPSVNDTATVSVYSNDGDEPSFSYDVIARPVPLPVNLTITNDTIESLEVKCYDAENLIILAGSGNTFVVESGGEATIIAGDSIIFKDGSRLEEGSEVHAVITTTDDYCGDGVYDYTIITSRDESVIEPILKKGINVFPNPTTGNVTILINDTEIISLQLQLYDLMGKLLDEKDLSESNRIVYDLQGYKNGLYFLRIIKENEITVMKIIKN